jgi:magnesium transporter
VGSLPEIPADGWAWVDVAGEAPDRVREICRSFGVPDELVGEALAEGSLPMLEEQRSLIYVVLNSFHTVPSGRLGPSEVDMFIGPQFILSIHDGEIASTAIAMERLDQEIGLAAPTPSGLLAHLAMMGSRRFPALIDQLEVQLDSLEEMAMRADPRALNEVYALRRDVIVLRRVLAPQRQIYDELAEEGHPLIDEASRHQFEKVAAYQTQVLESLDTARSLLGSVLETYRGAVADQTNEIVRLLTVFSAILLPLSLIAGIFGMNFIDIPLADEPLGFWVTVGVMALLALGLWLYFARRRFVGAPRLSELPRAVGLGIYHVGTAPIRVVAGGIESTIRMVTGSGERPEDEA